MVCIQCTSNYNTLHSMCNNNFSIEYLMLWIFLKNEGIIKVSINILSTCDYGPDFNLYFYYYYKATFFLSLKLFHAVLVEILIHYLTNLPSLDQFEILHNFKIQSQSAI